MESHSHQLMGPERDFYKGRKRTDELKTPTKTSDRFDKIEYLDEMIVLVSGAREIKNIIKMLLPVSSFDTFFK
jgi:hypothetical protein